MIDGFLCETEPKLKIKMVEAVTGCRKISYLPDLDNIEELVLLANLKNFILQKRILKTLKYKNISPKILHNVWQWYF